MLVSINMYMYIDTCTSPMVRISCEFKGHYILRTGNKPQSETKDKLVTGERLP